MRQIDNYIQEKLYIGKGYCSHDKIVNTILNITDYSKNDEVHEVVKNWLDEFEVNIVEYITDFDFNGRYDCYYINNDYKDLVKYDHDGASVLENDIRQCMKRNWSVKIDKELTIYWAKKCLCFCWTVDGGQRQLNLYICKK